MERLIGSIQPYPWGDRRAIAAIQGREPSGDPEAELWLGAHPVAPSGLGSGERSLLDAIVEAPAAMLGPEVADRFGRLPFLLKILAAAEPLSIQAHPDLARARAGFAREEEAGVAWNAPDRTYRDDNHKPELICALTPFEAKCGFRPLPATVAIVDGLAGVAAGRPGLRALASRVTAPGEPAAVLADVLRWLLRLEAAEAATLVGETVESADRLLAAPLAAALRPYEPDLRSIATISHHYPTDAGVVVSLLLNHVVLQPGQAMFLAAGNLHSYLRGTGVELMANSDNVVRGGLTAKHVDVDELLALVDTTPSPPPVQTPTGAEHTYAVPIPEFGLTRLVEPRELTIVPRGPEILLVTDGSVEVRPVGDVPSRVGGGEAVFLTPDDGPIGLWSEPGSLVWRATVGGAAGIDDA